MKSIPLALLCLPLLSSCLFEGSDSKDNTNGDTATHQVCGEDSSSRLTADLSINKANEPAMIHSLRHAANNFGDTLEEGSEPGGSAVTEMLRLESTTLVYLDASNYVCTEALRSENQCSWQVEGQGSTTTKRVSTTFSGSTYNAVVEQQTGNQFERLYSIDGTVGDVGNLTVAVYNQGQVSATYSVSRTTAGLETWSYLAGSVQIIASEGPSCNGSVDVDINSSDVIQLDANWTFNGTVTRGSLTYNSNSLDSAFNASW